MDATAPGELIQELHRAGFEPIDREIVERMVACGTGILAPLLDTIHGEVEDAVLARALALLGEVGTADTLEELLPFFSGSEEDDDDAVCECAEWAARRIARRMPRETLAAMKELAATADIARLSDLAKTLAIMPVVPGRTETLLSFGERIEDLEEDYDQALLAVTMVITAMFLEGPQSEFVSQVRENVAPYLAHESQKDIKTVEADLLKHPHHPDETDEPDVYALVCEGFDTEETVREEPKVGRNDPCWCGSGKKYKKCHLAEDDAKRS